jgi:hypothetical protein
MSPVRVQAVSIGAWGTAPPPPTTRPMKSLATPSTLTHALAGCGVAPRHVSSCDTATLFLSSLAAFLRSEGAPRRRPSLLRKTTPRALNVLPEDRRTIAARLGAWTTAVPARALRSYSSEAVSRWVTGNYPRRTYPVVLVGATNGAAIHLAAAVGAPWLPQTSLTLVRDSSLDSPLGSPLDSGDPRRAAARAAALVRPLLAAAPDVQVHQVLEDRGRFRPGIVELRLKRITLGPSYERFLLKHLAPGGTLVLVDCDSPRACLQASERHFVHLAPTPPTDISETTTVADARWGYAAELTTDALRFADRHGYRLLRLSFRAPDDLSPWIAELYRSRVVGDRAPHRLAVESGPVDPAQVLRTGSIPFWIPSDSSTDALDHYLDRARFEEIVRVEPRWSWSRVPSAASPPHHPLSWVDLQAHGQRDDLGPARLDLLQD